MNTTETNVINEDGSVQAIRVDNGYKFFVECDIEDDAFLIFLDELTEEQATTYAKLMSIAWDEAISKQYDSEGF